MYQVYLLRSEKDKSRSYVGLRIKGVKNRLWEHNSGKSKYTKSFLPWKLVYFENFYCRTCAEQREKFLKLGFGFRFRKIVLNNYPCE
ncbi:MAG: GIY-YIG nuclease family protein [Candidatus Curtissbacteria bacterium]|nr:GIY-YIG nuclease family protein [Candidatus Curtissbacteria bacterium]